MTEGNRLCRSSLVSGWRTSDWGFYPEGRILSQMRTQRSMGIHSWRGCGHPQRCPGIISWHFDCRVSCVLWYLNLHELFFEVKTSTYRLFTFWEHIWCFGWIELAHVKLPWNHMWNTSSYMCFLLFKHLISSHTNMEDQLNKINEAHTEIMSWETVF